MESLLQRNYTVCHRHYICGHALRVACYQVAFIMKECRMFHIEWSAVICMPCFETSCTILMLLCCAPLT